LDDRTELLAIYPTGTLQGTMILAVTLKRPELMDEVADRLERLVTE
jgi:hypothetical protein